MMAMGGTNRFADIAGLGATEECGRLDSPGFPPETFQPCVASFCACVPMRKCAYGVPASQEKQGPRLEATTDGISLGGKKNGGAKHVAMSAAGPAAGSETRPPSGCVLSGVRIHSNYEARRRLDSRNRCNRAIL
jgi:hypothetical protein